MRKKIVLSLICFLLIKFSFGQVKTRKTYDSVNKITFIEYFNRNKLTRVVSYYKNGKARSDNRFQANGKLFGTQIEYYENGFKKVENFILAIESIPNHLIENTVRDDNYVDVVTCKSTRFHINGKIKSEGYIVNGLRSGYWLFYNEKGEIDKSEFYKCLTKDEE